MRTLKRWALPLALFVLLLTLLSVALDVSHDHRHCDDAQCGICGAIVTLRIALRLLALAAGWLLVLLSALGLSRAARTRFDRPIHAPSLVALKVRLNP
ncbi:MAG: hypothetical protein LBN04_00505 [Oscillospiraceae bacterium]|jgi:hypothetical protein|nr:hypothetical protein [Oscillospiraceae bacterium]